MFPPEWLPTSSTGPSSGTLPEAAHLAAEPDRGQQPQQRQLLADVVGIPLVEVGLRDPLRRLGGHAAGGAREQRALGRESPPALRARRAGGRCAAPAPRASAPCRSQSRRRGPVAAATRRPPYRRRSCGRRTASAGRSSPRGARPGARGRSGRASPARRSAATCARGGRTPPGSSGSWVPQMNIAGGSSSASRG